MIPDATISAINQVRRSFLDAIQALPEVTSFATLCETSSEFEADFRRVAGVAHKRWVARECTGDVTCAIVGSSGHGKTTLLDEMFPDLAARGWLETDVTDTTSQALRIGYADRGAPNADDVLVESWSIEQIKQLMSHPQVSEQNARDSLEVTYNDDSVVIDGKDTTLDAGDLAEWRYPRRIELRPFASAYTVSPQQQADRKFIRALTVKEQSAVLEAGSVLEHEGRSYHGLQLRALVESVRLRDPFEQILGWADGDEQVRRLTFIDTPGLAVSSVVKDEVLRHFLGKKSNQIALELMRNDELDVVIHIVLCGQKSQFESLWTEIERECGRAEMEGIAERLILAVNGMNIYFTNPDIRAKYSDPETTAREGDHFAATLEDNILQRMSPRGHLRPAKIAFVDSRNIVDSFGDYADFYNRHRKTMEAWSEPGGVGHDTLARLGCAESFRENIDALADPEDRGQGYLIRQLLQLIQDKGSAILVRKHLLRTGLLSSLDEMLELLGRFYDGEGALNTAAADEALGQCLGFLDPKDPLAIERFAAKEVDPFIDGLIPDEDDDGGEDWVANAFQRLGELVKEAIIDSNEAKVPAAIWTEFGRLYDDRIRSWTELWGYTEVDFPPPPDSAVGTRDLVAHCLRLHSREILYQLLHTKDSGRAARSFAQSAEDQAAIVAVLRDIEAAKGIGAKTCKIHGVLA